VTDFPAIYISQVSSYTRWIKGIIRAGREQEDGETDNRDGLVEAKWVSTPLDMVPQKLLPAVRGVKGEGSTIHKE
jgi:hypothetical protein